MVQHVIKVKQKVEIQCQNTSIGELKQLAQRQSKIRDIAINRNTVSYLGFGRSDNKDSIGSGEKKNSNEGSPGEQNGHKKESGRKRKSGGSDCDVGSIKASKKKDCKKKFRHHLFEYLTPKTTESGTQTGDDETNSDND